MNQYYEFLGEKPARKVCLAVMDMWKAFHKSTLSNAPQAAILFDKFHVLRHLSDALDTVRKQEYALLSHPQNLSGDARKNLELLLAANKRLNTAYLLKESFAQLWDYNSEVWARKFFENWKASLKWQRLRRVLP